MSIRIHVLGGQLCYRGTINNPVRPRRTGSFCGPLITILRTRQGGVHSQGIDLLFCLRHARAGADKLGSEPKRNGIDGLK